MTIRLRGLKALTKPHAKPVFIFRKLGTQNHQGFVFKSALTISAWIANTLFLPAYAASLIDNSGIQFEQDTVLESNFVESHGAYQSTFGVINLDTQEKTPLLIETRPADQTGSIFQPSSKLDDVGRASDFLGTPGNAVPNPNGSFTFKAGNRYVFYLESTFRGRPVGRLYSTDTLNPNQTRQVQFRGAMENLCTDGMVVAWDDTGSRLVRSRPEQDEDFDDFVVGLKRSACPIGGGEPPSVASVPPPPATVAPAGSGARFPWGLAALPLVGLAFIGGGDDDGGSTSSPPGGSVPNNPGTPGTPGTPDNPRTPKPTPTTPIPEPMTILGSSTAIAMAGFLQRRRKQKQKSRSKSED